MNEHQSIKQGFFVKIRSNFYAGPFDTLNRAREEARNISPDLLIYHGKLIRISEEIIDDTELYLVPKLKDEK